MKRFVVKYAYSLKRKVVYVMEKSRNKTMHAITLALADW